MILRIYKERTRRLSVWRIMRRTSGDAHIREPGRSLLSAAPSPSFLDARPLAPFAADWRRSRGRLHAEPASPTRGEFQRDRDRLIHSTAFRRLAHKTQVFIPIDGDHFRTRLTHTIEVAQISRALARGLSLDEDLAEATALAHDLGHTCFGHAGEEVLDACMAPYGGFDHNAHALRIVTRLERRYAGWDGLNLCYETLEGLVKHNGPLRGPYATRYVDGNIPIEISEFNDIFPLNLETFASAEAQCAALADDIAYNAHDIDDGLRAGLFSLDDLREIDFLRGLLDEIATRHPGLERVRVIHELVRRVITRFVEDALAETGRRLAALAPASIADIRAAAAPVAAFSAAMAAAQKEIKEFLFARMYRHRMVLPVWKNAGRIVSGLFATFMAAPETMPEEWAQTAAQARTEAERARVVSDYIAGMTDRYALAQARKRLGADGAVG
jgi:dGTPase